MKVESLRPCLSVLLLASAALSARPAAAAGSPRSARESARESARGIPVAYDADVVVVGGSTGAVAAAVAAAGDGARVVLAAPYPYLGEDMTATLRLWLEEGEVPESPLAREIFSDPARPQPFVDPARIVPFTYESSRPSAGAHKDSTPPSRLSDGRWGSAVSQSVQYDGDVDITVRLAERAELESAYALVYHARDFQVASVTVSTSDDGKHFKNAATAANAAPAQGNVTEVALQLSVPVEGAPRFVRFAIRKTAASKRLLVGELAVVRKAPAATSAGTQPRKTPPAPPPRPLHVKKTLDAALLKAGVRFLYASYATDLLEDAGGHPAGVVIANRAGRQAIRARVIIDATERARVAELAGARFAKFPAGIQVLRSVVIGGKPHPGGGVRVRKVPPGFQRSGVPYNVLEYTLEIPMKDAGQASWAEAEQKVRDLTWDERQQFSSDALFQVPPDPVRAEVSFEGPWPGAAGIDLGALRPAGVRRVLVLGGRADVSRACAAKLLRPVAFMALGERVGREAAREALSLSDPRGVKVRTSGARPALEGDVREALSGIRPAVGEPERIPQGARALPVLGVYDVVVIGGGTSGAPAGIGAARAGARTLVVELLHGLGGVGTQGAISKYYWGNRVGFSAEVGSGTESWAIEQKMEWWRKALRKAGGDIWFGTIGCGAYVRDGRVAGAVIATPAGRGIVLAGACVDATGNADLASAAGAQTLYTDATDIAMQGTGLPPRRLGASYTNTDFTIVDETDMVDVWSVFVCAKEMEQTAFDIGRLIDTRERRRIVGGFTLTILDELNERTYPDTVVVCYSDFDTHGYTTDPYFTLQHPEHGKGVHVHVPYRALLPAGLEGVIIAGLGVSAQRDAIPLIRMQADMQNQGYAAGRAAAMAARGSRSLRAIDLRALQKHLVEIGSLPESVLTEKDSFPVSDERLAAAVKTAGDGYQGVEAILTAPDRALPLLREAYAAAKTAEEKLVYAHILAVLGDPSGVPELLKAVAAFPELDKGWRYTGMGQYGPNMSPLDRLIYALGKAGDRRATPVILEKLALLKPGDAFSHFRAMALALEMLGDPAAAKPLANLLAQPGIRGHAMRNIQERLQSTKKWPSWTATQPRSQAIRELILGRALFLCGDRDGLGREILDEYREDLRGHFSRHAAAVLERRGKMD